MKTDNFKTLELNELEMIYGGGCSWKGVANTAVGGAIGGSAGGTVTLPIIGTVAGWIGGGILGGLGGVATYGATCWW